MKLVYKWHLKVAKFNLCKKYIQKNKKLKKKTFFADLCFTFLLVSLGIGIVLQKKANIRHNKMLLHQG